MTNLIFGLVGIFIGGFLGHRLAILRDKASRRRNFIGFLEKWKSEISAPDRGPTTIGVSTPPAIKAYDAKLGAFREQIELVRDAFSDRQTFDAFAIRLANLKTEDWDKKNPRSVIVEAIEKLIEFCR